tara:strand:- start:22528 stop:23298 length:771 start_codon:yes stop_codon:yes gene_type:complete
MKKDRAHAIHKLIGVTLMGLTSLAIAQPNPLIYESTDGQFRYVLHNGLSASEVAPTIEVLEENYKRVFSDLNVKSVPQTTVTIWNDSESYYRAQEETTGQRFVGSGGYVWWAEVPELRLRHGTRREAKAIALHEFAHIVSMVRNRSIPNRPRWLWETIAIYATRDIDSEVPNIPEFITQRDFPSLDELNVGFNSADESRNIYDVGFFLGEYIVSKWGIEAFGELTETNGDIPGTLQISISEFERGWEEYFEEHYLD